MNLVHRCSLHIYPHHLLIIPMEIFHLLLHLQDHLLHSIDLIVFHLLINNIKILQRNLIDFLLCSLILQRSINTGSVDIKKVKGVLLIKVGSPFALHF